MYGMNTKNYLNLIRNILERKMRGPACWRERKTAFLVLSLSRFTEVLPSQIFVLCLLSVISRTAASFVVQTRVERSSQLFQPLKFHNLVRGRTIEWNHKMCYRCVDIHCELFYCTTHPPLWALAAKLNWISNSKFSDVFCGFFELFLWYCRWWPEFSKLAIILVNPD